MFYRKAKRAVRVCGFWEKEPEERKEEQPERVEKQRASRQVVPPDPWRRAAHPWILAGRTPPIPLGEGTASSGEGRGAGGGRRT